MTISEFGVEFQGENDVTRTGRRGELQRIIWRMGKVEVFSFHRAMCSPRDALRCSLNENMSPMQDPRQSPSANTQLSREKGQVRESSGRRFSILPLTLHGLHVPVMEPPRESTLYQHLDVPYKKPATALAVDSTGAFAALGGCVTLSSPFSPLLFSVSDL